MSRNESGPALSPPFLSPQARNGPPVALSIVSKRLTPVLTSPVSLTQPDIAFIDKTQCILELPDRFQHVILRPPRFGKTALLSTSTITMTFIKPQTSPRPSAIVPR
ncbi:hypothetical protein C8R44DRAFT_867217 [Mycena epipterygia]|nr:hypothetical protein C8R44DRAFT_867217 [Mycena epipterygia]